MEKLQLGRKRKTDAEKPRMDPLMRALKALHSAGSPEAMTPEELMRFIRDNQVPCPGCGKRQQGNRVLCYSCKLPFIYDDEWPAP